MNNSKNFYLIALRRDVRLRADDRGLSMFCGVFDDEADDDSGCDASVTTFIFIAEDDDDDVVDEDDDASACASSLSRSASLLPPLRSCADAALPDIDDEMARIARRSLASSRSNDEDNARLR